MRFIDGPVSQRSLKSNTATSDRFHFGSARIRSTKRGMATSKNASPFGKSVQGFAYGLRPCSLTYNRLAKVRLFGLVCFSWRLYAHTRSSGSSQAPGVSCVPVPRSNALRKPRVTMKPSIGALVGSSSVNGRNGARGARVSNGTSAAGMPPAAGCTHCASSR